MLFANNLSKKKWVTQSHLSSKIPYVLPQQTTAAAAFFGFLTAKWHNTLCRAFREQGNTR